MAKQREKSALRLRIENILSTVFPGQRPADTPEKGASFPTGGHYRHTFGWSYNGEKNFGEMGPVRDYRPDYTTLRLRSWQSYLESEISKTVLDKFTLWMVSKGLKLQCSPDPIVLASEGIKIKPERFNDVVEARFSVWARSKYCSYNSTDNLANLAKEAFKNSKIGGDVLVILRYVDGAVKVQLIDGAHVQSPGYGSDYYGQKLENGNTIVNGVEINDRKEPQAYHVKTAPNKWERIEAKSPSSGITTAFLVYGNRYRIDSQRGMPLIATCLETLKKLERYKEAAVGSAEERQKIVYTIVHNRDSTGESPLAKQLASAINADAQDDMPVDRDGNQLANQVAATTNKATYNMPIGSEMKVLESKNEMFFKEFYQTNADIVCAAVGIPPNVAFSIYNDSFSASRAATKDWEHTISVNREDFSYQFYQKIYCFWLYTEVLANKVQAPGYVEAFRSRNWMAVEAYHTARFTGPMFPHIDPLKEVNAERAKLGTLGDTIPLTTVEQATEALNGGDSDSNIEQFAEEVAKARVLKVVAEEAKPTN